LQNLHSNAALALRRLYDRLFRVCQHEEAGKIEKFSTVHLPCIYRPQTSGNLQSDIILSVGEQHPSAFGRREQDQRRDKAEANGKV
jgi:hypothetical protein